ncbi:MAG TPA: hypothetical protein VJR48_00160 [Ktedonobacterales bacterium]|nr:hypothetical protein [Ktedonobacterales bacterium]
MRARRIEFGAGIAACALSVLAFAFVVFAPIVPVCSSPAQLCPRNAPRYVTMIQGSPGAVVWLFVLAMLALSLMGGVGAIVEARTGRRVAAIPLWAAAVLVFGGCALAAGGAGIIYLPSVLALGLAAYASILARLSAQNRIDSLSPTPGAE